MKNHILTLLRVSLKIAALVVATASGAADSLSTESIVFGMSSPLSGPTGAYGRQMKEGIEACFKQVNESGGIAGHKLSLISLDDGYEVAAALANTKRLLEQEKVFALMGFYGTAASTAVLPVIEQMNVPLVGTISGASNLRMPEVRNMFHLRASYDDETSAIVQNLITVGMTRVAVFYQDDGFGQAGLRGLQKALEAKALLPIAIASVERNSTDVTAAVKVISSSNPQVVVMVSLYRPTAAFIRQIRQSGIHPYFVALSPVGTDQLILELGDKEARGIQVAQVIPYPWGEKLQIVREYKRDLANYSPGAIRSYYGLEGYLNARLLVAAIQRAGPRLTRERLTAALRAAPFDLGGYRVEFDAHSNKGSSYVEISVIGEGGHILN